MEVAGEACEVCVLHGQDAFGSVLASASFSGSSRSSSASANVQIYRRGFVREFVLDTLVRASLFKFTVRLPWTRGLVSVSGVRRGDATCTYLPRRFCDVRGRELHSVTWADLSHGLILSSPRTKGAVCTFKGLVRSFVLKQKRRRVCPEARRGPAGPKASLSGLPSTRADPVFGIGCVVSFVL